MFADLPTIFSKRRLVVCMLLGSGAGSAVMAQEVRFDVDTLRSLGISPTVADYYSESPKFPPGPNRVNVLVNGSKTAAATIFFGQDGAPCLNKSLLAKLGIEWPETGNEEKCLELRQIYPDAVTTTKPSVNSVEILVPPQSVRPVVPATLYNSGGTGALLNYRFFTNKLQGFDGGQSTQYGDVSFGANWDDWIFRGRGIYSNSQGESSFQHQDAYFQKTFADQKTTLQFGQINLRSGMFSVPSISGFQLFPEQLLMKDEGVSASGIAQTPARVEVRQGGVLIYSTLVPAGPFTLNQLPLFSQAADLQVTVIESNGIRNSFVVPSSSFAANFIPAQRGFSFAAGKPRRMGNETESFQIPWIVSGTYVEPLPSLRANLTTGLLLARDYRSMGVSMDASLGPSIRAYARSVFSNDGRNSETGSKHEIGASASITPELNVSITDALQTRGFRELAETSIRGNRFLDYTKNSFSASASYSMKDFGAVSAGYTRTSSFMGGNGKRLLLSWSRSFEKFSLSLSASLGSGPGSTNQYYASLSFKLDGNENLSSTAVKSGNQLQLGATYDKQVNEYFGYNVAASSTSPDHRQNYMASIRFLPKYTSVNASISDSGGAMRSYSASLSGGIAFDGIHPLFSPYEIGDTYGIMTVPGISGARLETPSGPVWTDFFGKAVAPWLTPYQKNRFELSMANLPRNVEVQDAVNVLEVQRGSVSRMEFKATRTRRFLIQVRTQNEKSLEGAGVYDKAGKFRTIVGPDNSIFLDAGEASGGSFEIRPDGGPACQVVFRPPADATDDSPYERSSATCTPDDTIFTD